MRKFTWVIIGVNALFVWWIIWESYQVNARCDLFRNYPIKEQECLDAESAGLGFLIFFILILWAIVDLILGVIWLVTNRKQRECPVCAKRVRAGLTTCATCGFDFAAAQGQPAQPQNDSQS